jgi:hypothetical protein
MDACNLCGLGVREGSQTDVSDRRVRRGTCRPIHSGDRLRCEYPLLTPYPLAHVEHPHPHTFTELTNLTVHMYVQWHFGDARRNGTPEEQTGELPLGVKSLFGTPGAPLPLEQHSGVEYLTAQHSNSTNPLGNVEAGSSGSGSGSGSSGRSGAQTFSTVSSGFLRRR